MALHFAASPYMLATSSPRQRGVYTREAFKATMMLTWVGCPLPETEKLTCWGSLALIRLIPKCRGGTVKAWGLMLPAIDFSPGQPMRERLSNHSYAPSKSKASPYQSPWLSFLGAKLYLSEVGPKSEKKRNGHGDRLHADGCHKDWRFR